MDTKELLITITSSLFSQLTRYENARVTFTVLLLFTCYLETNRIINLALTVVLVTYCQRLCRYLYEIFAVKPFVCQGRAVFISGCDSGLGHDIAKHLDVLGFAVFAGCLYPNGYGAKLLKAYCSQRMHIVALDVRSDDSVQAALSYVEKHLPKQGLWALVNNAGIQINGEIELMLLSLCQRVHEVNLFGVIRMTKAFLPLVRKSAGRLVTVTSVYGLYSSPTLYAYTSSKHGVETLMDSLRLEMKKFGVKVSLVEPGTNDHSTSIASKENISMQEKTIDQMWEEATEEQQKAYGRTHLSSFVSLGKETFKSSGDTTPIVLAVEDALTKGSPKFRYIVDGTYKRFYDEYAIMARIYCWLPSWLSDVIVVKCTGCDVIIRK